MSTLYIVIGVAVVLLIALTRRLFHLQQKKKKARAAAEADEPVGPGGDEISLLVREAENKLVGGQTEGKARSRQSARSSSCCGEAGSAKTSVMLHSGLDPELLAGQVYQNSNVVPTRSANIWFSRRSRLRGSRRQAAGR